MTVVLIATGGTIACTHNKENALVPDKSGYDLAATLSKEKYQGGEEYRDIEVQEFRSLDSSAISLRDLDELICLVKSISARPEVERIIITHGTDSMEETAIALALFHDKKIPVVLTGAQRPFDHPHSDGPQNLAQSLEVNGGGVFIQFGGVTTTAWGARKQHTFSLNAFSQSHLTAPNPLPYSPLSSHQVAIIAAYPGAPGTFVDAAVAAGYSGIVVESMGSGNVSPDMGLALARALKSGVAVVIATRVARGPVELIYGGDGGGATLKQLGAVSAKELRAGQARIVLSAALATGTDPKELFA